MLMKAILAVAALVAPVLALEDVLCKRNDTELKTKALVVSINSATEFCTMLTGYGVYPVAPNEGCAGTFCTSNAPLTIGAQKMPNGYILSTNYLKTTNYTQITGCIDSSVWAQNPTDEGGQMDSHGWLYQCQGFKKFVSLIEPATNTYCLRCCVNDDNVDCNTSVSTKGCWNVVPGDYMMADKSACKPPVGAPVANTTTVPTGVSGAPSGTATAPGAQPTPSGSAGSNTQLPPAAKPNTNAGARVFSSYEVIGAAAALAMAVVATL